MPYDIIIYTLTDDVRLGLNLQDIPCHTESGVSSRTGSGPLDKTSADLCKITAKISPERRRYVTVMETFTVTSNICRGSTSPGNAGKNYIIFVKTVHHIYVFHKYCPRWLPQVWVFHIGDWCILPVSSCMWEISSLKYPLKFGAICLQVNAWGIHAGR